MTAVEPVGHAINLILAYDVRIVEVGVVHGDTEVENHIHTSPVAESDGHTIRIILVETFNIVGKLLDKWTEALLVGLVLHRDAVECDL